ncbi:MAG: helix-turn-helix transcriptional regulator [Bacteroidota bacterium]
MIGFYVKEFMRMKGHSKPRVFTLRKLEIGQTAAYNIMFNRAKEIKLKDLETLCMYLNCTPNDILNYTPDNRVLHKGHELFKLMKNPNPQYPAGWMVALGPEKLLEASDYLRQLAMKQNEENEKKER